MRRYLTPRMLGAHVLAVACIGIAAALGFWQLEAWQQQRTAETVDLTGATPVALSEVMSPDEPFPGDRVGQPVTVSGTWLPEATVFVSGRARDGVDGYWVVTPLTSGGPEDPAVPIVRGWVEEPTEAPAAPTGPGEVVGWLQPPEGTGAVDDDPTDDVFPQLRVADLVQRVDAGTYEAYAVAQEGVDALPAGDLEQLPEAGRFTALRNLLYAIEWWVFGAFAAFIWWRFVREVDDELPTAHPVASGT